MSTPPPLQSEPMLAYASEYVDTRRPGIIIAMGVLSIVLAIGYGLTAGFSILMTIGLAAAPGGGGPTTTTFAAPTPDGIGSPQRALLIARVQELTPLTPVRRDVLEGFLAQKGSDIDARARTLQDAARAARIIASAETGPEGQTYLDFNGSRLTLTDTTAVFEPIGTTDLITVDFAGSNPPPGEPGFVPEGLLKNGRGSVSNAQPTTGPATPPRAISTGSVVLQSISGVLSCALAVLLLVAGIFTVRSRPIGRRLHLWWAWLKIVASVLAAAGTIYFYYEVIAVSAANNPAASTPATLSVMIGVMSLGLAVLYPIAVLIVMNTRSVRNYLSSLT